MSTVITSLASVEFISPTSASETNHNNDNLGGTHSVLGAGDNFRVKLQNTASLTVTLHCYGGIDVSWSYDGGTVSKVVSVDGTADTATPTQYADSLYHTVKITPAGMDDGQPHTLEVKGIQYVKDVVGGSAEVTLVGSNPTVMPFFGGSYVRTSLRAIPSPLVPYLKVEGSYQVVDNVAGKNCYFATGSGTRMVGKFSEIWANVYGGSTPFETYIDGKLQPLRASDKGNIIPLGSAFSWCRVATGLDGAYTHEYEMDFQGNYVAEVIGIGAFDLTATALPARTWDLHCGDSRVAGNGIGPTGGTSANWTGVASNLLGHGYRTISQGGTFMQATAGNGGQASTPAIAVLQNTIDGFAGRPLVSQPTKVIVEWGINDLSLTSFNGTKQGYLDAFKNTVYPYLRTKFPAAELVMMSMFPAGSGPNGNSLIEDWTAGMASTVATMKSITPDPLLRFDDATDWVYTPEDLHPGIPASISIGPSYAATIAGVPRFTVSSTTISPTTATLAGLASTTFTGTVTGTNNPPAFSVYSTTLGSIDKGGVYFAPAATSSAQTATVTRMSLSDQSKTATATVTISSTVSPPTVTSISVSPTTATGSTTFTATVTGTNSPSQVVTWTTTAGSIDSAGVFTKPGNTNAIQTITVTATSTVSGYTTIYGTATVTIAADTTAPTYLSSSLNTAGTVVAVALTEAASAPVLPATGVTGFTVKVNGATRTQTSATASGTTVSITLTSTVFVGDVITVAYASGNVTDSATPANAMATFTAQAVSNGSTQEGPVTFSPAPASTVTVGGTVTLSDVDTAAVLYYTINTSGGTPADPTTASTLYSAAVALSVAGTTTIKAISTHSGDTPSAVATAVYTVVAASTTSPQMRSSLIKRTRN